MISKKASMELGISTVVVLVIAMVIIAGGIAFIRGFFTKGTNELSKAFNVADFGIQPTAIDPLVLAEGSPSIKSGDTQEVVIGFYNAGTGEKTIQVEFGDCVTTAEENENCDNLKPLLVAMGHKVQPGDSAAFKTFVTAACDDDGEKGEDLNPGQYICQLKAKNSDPPVEAQITFTIES